MRQRPGSSTPPSPALSPEATLEATHQRMGHSARTPQRVRTPSQRPSPCRQPSFNSDPGPARKASRVLEVRAEAPTLPCWSDVTVHSDNLDHMMGPGDILVARDNNAVLQIGAMGGYFGHVMLVTAPACCIQRGSTRAKELQNVWPQGQCVTQMWAVPVVESTRSAETDGLREATLLLYVQRPSGNVVVAAELSGDDELAQCDGDRVEIWQSPAPLRELINSCPWQARSVLMAETFAEMMKDMSQSNWSELTAVRAALMPAALDTNCEGMQALTQVSESWGAKPICTSVAIIFWQRVLCKLAAVLNGGFNKVQPERTMALIHRFMPVRADRSLPSELLEALMSSGWTQIAQLTQTVKM